MPRSYYPTKRPFDPHREKKIEDSLKDIQGGLSLRKAAEKYDISKSVLDQQKKGGKKIVGCPTALSAGDEELIAQHADDVAEWGFPVGRFEIQMMVKDLLDKKGIKDGRFTNNIPGDDWYRNFVERNNRSERLAANIRVACAKVDKKTVDTFFDKLEASGITDIKAENIYNYDETNFQNNTGKSWVIVQRGRRRVEKVSDDSKQSFSVMWCGSVAGQMLPPTVVYKAKHVYQNWTGGATGTSFMSSDSGWFNSHTFSLWFTESFLTSVADKEGPILLLGDNLGSHFNADLLSLAKEKNVYFAMLPPNATHLLQPLDVAVFAPMKSQWQRVLKEYRVESRRVGDIPKSVFPRLLKLLWDSMAPTVGDNLMAGFRTCGLVPLDRSNALKKLSDVVYNPTNNEGEIRTVLNESLMSLLQVNKKRSNDDEEKEKRGKRLPKPKRTQANVPPGLGLELVPPVAGDLLEVAFIPNGETDNYNTW